MIPVIALIGSACLWLIGLPYWVVSLPLLAAGLLHVCVEADKQ